MRGPIISLAALGAVLVGVGLAAQAGRGGARATIKPGEECPPGMTEVRPQNCQAPEFPPPSIVDYRPRSTLVVPAHSVPKAKFPAIDYHGHPGNLTSAEGVANVVKALDTLNVRLIVAADNLSGARLTNTLQTINGSPHRDRIRVLAGISFNDVGPGFGQNAARELEAAIKAGAVGLGEISKSLGLNARKADGSRLRIDDPELDPIWQTAARLNVPVFIHTADPSQFFEPLDYKNERWLEQALFPNRRFPPEEFPSFEQLATERDNLFKKHPQTRFVMAHFGWHAADLARVGRILDAMPNVYTEVGAVLYDFGRQPRTAHDFFVKYQDRILFGKDSFQPVEYPYYWRVFETTDEYFDYYRDYHAFWKLYGMGLPDAVLKKLYYANALKITPGLPQTGWPE
jgi:predicted TIM-barrel fold metal-dependent hydrolase